MRIEEILKLTRREALDKHVEELDEAYYKLASRHFCRVCPTDITTMFNELKKRYMNNTEFRLKKEKAYFKVSNGVYISNDKMTDKLAIEFLRNNEGRIVLFSHFPSNWKELINPTEEKVAEKASEELAEPLLRNVLEDMKLKDLKIAYPDVKVEFGQKKSDFIDKIMEEEANKQ